MTTDPLHLAPWLWALLALFAARVAGQALVAFAGVRWLPPMEQWQSGLLPYRVLLAAQVAILLVLGKVCLDFTGGAGWFVEGHPWFGGPVLWFGWLYLAAMVVRYPIQMALHPEDRWLGRTIPIVFHWVLATFVILFGSFHRVVRPAPTGRSLAIAEPMTLATDYLVAIAALLWGARVARQARSGGQRAVRWWAVAFAAVAFAALAGGTYHGFAPQLPPAVATTLWKLTVLAAGVVGFAIVAGAVIGHFAGPLRRTLLAVAALELAIYTGWMLGHDDYLWVIVHTAGAMALALVLAALGWVERRDPAAPWIAAAVLVSFAAAGVQASGLALHRHFNHNDLYHVVQIAGLYLFHRGALLTRDGGSQVDAAGSGSRPGTV